MDVPKTENQLQDLLGRISDGAASHDEIAWLDTALAVDMGIRQRYLEFMVVELGLSSLGAGDRSPQADSQRRAMVDLDRVFSQQGEETQASLSPTHSFFGQSVRNTINYVTTPTPLSITIASLFIVALLVVMAVISPPLHRQWTAPSLPTDQPTDQPIGQQPTVVARLSRTIDCQWVGGSIGQKEGSSLTEGELLDLKQGRAMVTFEQGATVILEGPVQFRTTSNNGGELLSGKLTAQVPRRAIGFTVETLAAQLLDLGTEFGALVDSHRSTLVHVYSGKVEVGVRGKDGLIAKSDKRRLSKGESLKTTAAGSSSRVVPRNLEFVRTKDFGKKADYIRWMKYSRNLRGDPDLVAYYSFDPPAGNTNRLINEAVATKGRFDGQLGSGPDALDRPRWTTGRWQGKGALKFDAVRHARVFVADWPSAELKNELTAAMWCRLSWREGPSHTLLSHGNGSRHVFHFSTAGKGPFLQLITAVNSPGEAKLDAENGFALLPDGRWIHLAFTIRAAGGPVSAYLNGKQIDLGPVVYSRKELVSSSNALVIGGTNVGGSCFAGLMDELVLLRRAMRAAEIKTMYASGKPSP